MTLKERDCRNHGMVAYWKHMALKPQHEQNDVEQIIIKIHHRYHHATVETLQCKAQEHKKNETTKCKWNPQMSWHWPFSGSLRRLRRVGSGSYGEVFATSYRGRKETTWRCKRTIFFGHIANEQKIVHTAYSGFNRFYRLSKKNGTFDSKEWPC